MFIRDFNVVTEARGSDWIELAADQATMFYTSEGRRILRYDVANDVQLPDFAVVPGFNNLFALRLLPPGDGSGGLLVADRADVKRLNGAGAVVQTYDVAGEDVWFSLNLDPNGTSFWAGDLSTNNFYRFSIASGAVEVGPINTFTNSTGDTDPDDLSGICVKGEPTAGGGGGQCPPPTDGDDDGDGLKNSAESLLGLLLFDSDSDGDGTPDGDEDEDEDGEDNEDEDDDEDDDECPDNEGDDDDDNDGVDNEDEDDD